MPGGDRVGMETSRCSQDPAHLLGIRAGPVQEQGVENILAPDEEPVTVLIQVQGAEAQEASVAKEDDRAVGAQKLCQGGREASGGAIPAPKTCGVSSAPLIPNVPSRPWAQVLASSLGDVPLPSSPHHVPPCVPRMSAHSPPCRDSTAPWP